MTKRGISVDVIILTIVICLCLTNELIIKQITWTLSPIFHYYFNDLLAPLLLMSACNTILYYKNLPRILLCRQLFSMWVLCSVAWEWLAIYLKPTSTFDVVDICVYFTGIAIYKVVNILSKVNNK